MEISSSLDPLRIPDAENEQIRVLRQTMLAGQAALIGSNNERREIPADVYQLFVRVLEHLERKQAVSIVPYRDELTTQTAADLLSMSRQHFVRLLDAEELPHHKVGAHRRVYLKDLLAYKEARDRKRRAAINAMAREALEAGVYDKTIEPDE
ncbi:MAG: helix-turn-helix domain-containing protein [Acidobacteria bacterium]|nr:helix-turn-helix domain-containing protein [Acidobacteriota bacterium]